ncbi:hypothetical protein [Flavobacterium sp. DSR3-2]|uniref:hypothetical protein n=1 Tax=Flavobacterium sp. DSR3-2 TaxID=2804634 RepID=UPI003CF56EDD
MLDFYHFENNFPFITATKENEEASNIVVEINFKILIKKIRILLNAKLEFKKLIDLFKKGSALELEILNLDVNDSC